MTRRPAVPTEATTTTARAAIADAAAVIERLAADLAIGEEPSGFAAALEIEPGGD